MQSRNRMEYKHLFVLSHQVQRMQKQTGDEAVKIGMDRGDKGTINQIDAKAVR